MPHCLFAGIALLMALPASLHAQETLEGQPPKLKWVLESEQRGILPEREQAILNEARRRGLAPPPISPQHRDYHTIKKGHDVLSEKSNSDDLTDEEYDRLFALEDALMDLEIERFELFNRCRPMRLLVEGLPDEARAIGLTKKALNDTTENRLSTAGLFTKNPLEASWTNLYVNVNLVGAAFSVSVEYRKNVIDDFGHDHSAVTWKSRATGTHTGDSDFIVAAISEKIDKFLVEYLRVNKAACDGK